MIKAVIFDIDDTLYDFENTNKKAMQALEVYCKEKLQLENPLFMNIFKEAQMLVTQRVKCDCATVHNRLIRFQCMLELVKKPLFPHAMEMYKAYWGTLLAHAKPEPGVIALMKLLKSKGIYIGIGTDMTALIQYKKLEKLQVASMIDAIVTSEEAGVEKPDTKFFKLCVQKTGFAPEECLFIGDNLEKDVRGPQEIGMQSIWYRKEPLQTNEDYRGVQIKCYEDCIQGETIKFGTIIM